MPSAKGKLIRLLGGMLLSHAKVVSTEAVGPGFRRLELRGDFAKPNPGDKLQILLPSDDVRSYTPIAGGAGELVLLGWAEASGPGARWLTEVKVGTDVSFARPQRSLVLPAGPVILVGDETSVAVAASYEAAHPGRVQAVFEGRSSAAVFAAASAVGLKSVRAMARGDTSATVAAIMVAKSKAPDATIALTGGSELIVAVRAALREQGLRDVKCKAYWIPGKAGLD